MLPGDKRVEGQMTERGRKAMKALKGITVESFAHPDDAALMRRMEKAKIDQLIEWISKAETRCLMEMKLMGRYVRLNETDMSGLYATLQDVCRVLDYPRIPRVFMYRASQFDWEVCIGEEPVIILTDYVLNEFDEAMLRFHLGGAVTAIKSKTYHLRVASTFALSILKTIPVLGDLMTPMLAGCARAATLTEDRGGLLACQDERAAWRYMLRLSGIPLELIDERIVPDYIAEYKSINCLSHVSKQMQTLMQMKPWQNDRLVALYDWYLNGNYNDILDEY